MPVLIEATSVVVRRDAIVERFSGGWDGFLSSVPNRTLCYDDDIARVGFMERVDVGQFIEHLVANGLVFVRDGKAVDFIVVDQLDGPTGPCDWIEFYHLHHLESNIRIMCCRLVGCDSNRVALPESWEYEGSISQKPNRILDEQMKGRLQLLRHENGMDVYLDRNTAEERYVGRTSCPTMKLKPYSLVAPDGTQYFLRNDVVMGWCVNRKGKEELFKCDSLETLDRQRRERPECCFIISPTVLEQSHILLPEGIQDVKQLPCRQRRAVRFFTTWMDPNWKPPKRKWWNPLRLWLRFWAAEPSREKTLSEQVWENTEHAKRQGEEKSKRGRS